MHARQGCGEAADGEDAGALERVTKAMAIPTELTQRE